MGYEPFNSIFWGWPKKELMQLIYSHCQYVCQVFGRKSNQLWLKMSKRTEDPICGQKLITSFNHQHLAIIHARMTKLFEYDVHIISWNDHVSHCRWLFKSANCVEPKRMNRGKKQTSLHPKQRENINNQQTRSKFKWRRREKNSSETVNRFAESALHFFSLQIEIETHLEKNGTFASRRRVCVFLAKHFFCLNWNMFVLFIYYLIFLEFRWWKMRHTHTHIHIHRDRCIGGFCLLSGCKAIYFYCGVLTLTSRHENNKNNLHTEYR